MQVTNSTGRNTDYRVGAGGGTNVSYAPNSSTATLVGGLLNPGGQELCASAWPCKVEFWIDGTLAVWQSFDHDPGQVTLRETDGRYWIEVIPYATEGDPTA